VSTTGDPTGGWYVGGSSFGTGLGDFIDFPQLGMDLHSIIMTFNNFPPPGFGGLNGATFAISKAYLYNGLAWHSYIFTGSACTVAPPYVLDNNGVDYVMAFCPGDDKVWIGSLTNSGLSNVHLNLWDNTVSVPVFGIPPDAPQFHYSLDTGDNRFENRSVQVGSRILNTATISFDRGAGARATAAWFDFNIDASPHTGQSYGLWFGSTTSSDWHPSINANTVGASSRLLGETFGTWMSVDQANNINVQLRAIGATGDDAGYGSGITVYTGPWALTNQTDSNGIHRTGDYSYIALYPAAALGCTQPNEIGILTGETAGPSLGLWGTRVGIVKHC
ncbi:MAG TPA: hypothetical protein VEK82_02245, partial [Stellaceae bacterium]|nr:hypothetical protein [Stellaceae bacterium]